MSNYTISQNMNLIIPTVGLEAGPQYATDVNNSLNIIDGHNHTAGSGVTLTQASLNINGSLTLNQNALTSSKFINFSLQSTSPTASTAPDSLYVDNGGNLHYINNTTDVQVTSGNSLNVTSSGISNGNASASFQSGVLVVYSNNTNSTPGNIQSGSILLGNNTSDSPFVTLSPPTLSSSYTITLPFIPNSTQTNPSSAPILIDTSGNMTTGNSYDYVLPAGMMMPSASQTTPPGWLFCDGTAYSRTTYANLFNAIGTNYGTGDGSTTFNVPDTRGYFLRGVASGSAFSRDPDYSSRTSQNGGATGLNLGSVQQGQIQSHNHGVTDPGHGHNWVSYAGSITNGGRVASSDSTSPQSEPSVNFMSNAFTGISIQNTGGNQTNPLNIYVNYYIKY